MTCLLREIAKLPQVQGALSVELLAGEPSRRFYLLRASVRPGADLAALQGDETEGIVSRRRASVMLYER